MRIVLKNGKGINSGKIRVLIGGSEYGAFNGAKFYKAANTHKLDAQRLLIGKQLKPVFHELSKVLLKKKIYFKADFPKPSSKDNGITRIEF